MPEIWLAQYLCPRRHAICATPYERPADPAEIERKLLAELQRLGFSPWCGLCGSRDLHFEHGKMRAANWDEAWRSLQQGERDNIATRVYFDALKGNHN